MSDDLLRELIGEVRALRHTLAAAHAQGMVASLALLAPFESAEARDAAKAWYQVQALASGDQGAAQGAPVAEKSP